MLISIITVNYNNVEGLKKTMTSVFEQTYNELEYIVIDGGSADGSKEFLEAKKHDIDYWISEPDTGIYNAMNKGIRVAKGTYLLFLNSGDSFVNKHVVERFVASNPNEDILYGFLEIVSKDVTWIKTYPKVLTFSYFFKDSLPHSAGAFFKRSCFTDDLKQYDTTLKIMADWKWSVIGLFKKGFSYRLMDEVIGVFEFGDGISSLPSNKSLLLNERQHILNSEFKYLYPEVKALMDFKRTQTKLMKTKLFKFALILNRLFKKILKR